MIEIIQVIKNKVQGVYYNTVFYREDGVVKAKTSPLVALVAEEVKEPSKGFLTLEEALIEAENEL